jgi:predicted RNA-binding Zn ribbon-like protein
VPLPDHVAGHVALELCNTKALWGLPTEREYLVDFTALVLWAREHAVLTAREAVIARGDGMTDRERRAELRRVRDLRRALFTAVTRSGAERDDALAAVHGHVAHAVSRAPYRITARGRAEPHVAFGPAAIVDRLALAGHELLVQYGPDAVGLCASEACGWVFLDPSHRRRWCSMAVCGNRAKARRFAQRRRESARPS